MLSILFIFIGLLCNVFGLISWRKKILWVHQGFFPRPVNKDGYTKFMGILDIIMGLIWIMIGVYYLYKGIPSWLTFSVLTVYIALIVYGEKKYKIDMKNKQHTS